MTFGIKTQGMRQFSRWLFSSYNPNPSNYQLLNHWKHTRSYTGQKTETETANMRIEVVYSFHCSPSYVAGRLRLNFTLKLYSPSLAIAISDANGRESQILWPITDTFLTIWRPIGWLRLVKHSSNLNTTQFNLRPLYRYWPWRLARKSTSMQNKIF